MRKLDKKGQSLSGLYGGILVVASIGILLALVMFILSSMGTSFQAQDTAGSVANETGFANTTGYTLTKATEQDFASPVITALYNRTDGTSIDVGNATDTLIDQFVDFLPWLGIILLVLAAGVVLFFVIRSFAGGGRTAGV